MKRFDCIISFCDGTETKFNVTAVSFRQALTASTAFIPAWSNRVVASISLVPAQ